MYIIYSFEFAIGKERSNVQSARLFCVAAAKKKYGESEDGFSLGIIAYRVIPSKQNQD